MLHNPVVAADCDHIHSHFTERGRLKDSTVLLTGCGGFLGFYFLHYLVRHGRDLGIRRVIGLDNFKLQRSKWLEDLCAQFPQYLQVHTFDIAADDLSNVEGALQADHIIHMASIASPTFYRQYPLATIEANIWGLRALLEHFKDRKLKGFLFFSSSEIYGDPDAANIPTAEEYNGNVSCVGPRACYDESKRFGETVCSIYAQQYRLPLTVVRPFNNYGPGMRLNDGRIPADMAKAVVEGRDLVLFSDGTPTRTFCYVADAVVGYLKALTYGRFDYFNIGIDTPEVSMRDFAQICAGAGRKIFNYSGQVRLDKPAEKDYLTHNPSRRCPDISKARRMLGFAPSISVEQGVERFFEFLKTSKA